MSVDICLRKRLPGFVLDATFSSEAGFIVIHGPSGAGKSLTLRMIAGLEQPDGGHIRINGCDHYESDASVSVPTRNRGVGFVFQDYALFPHLSVEQNVGFGLRRGWLPETRNVWNQRVGEMLEAFGLEPQRKQPVTTLSGGQKQRVALARALAPRPSVLLLDEPFSALDESLRRTMRRELRDAHQSFGVQALMVTHDVADVEALADDVVVMNEGQVTRTWSLRKLCRRRNVARFVSTHTPPVVAQGV